MTAPLLGYGFACVAIAGICGANTVMTRIFNIQSLPPALGLVAMYFALHTRAARP